MKPRQAVMALSATPAVKPQDRLSKTPCSEIRGPLASHLSHPFSLEQPLTGSSLRALF